MTLAIGIRLKAAKRSFATAGDLQWPNRCSSATSTTTSQRARCAFFGFSTFLFALCLDVDACYALFDVQRCRLPRRRRLPMKTRSCSARRAPKRTKQQRLSLLIWFELFVCFLTINKQWCRHRSVVPQAGQSNLRQVRRRSTMSGSFSFRFPIHSSLISLKGSFHMKLSDCQREEVKERQPVRCCNH